MAAGRDLGAALATEGRFDEAAAVFSDAAAIGERLDARGELTPPARNDWAWTLVLLGRARRDGGDAESAREAWTKAVEVSEPLAGESAEQAHLDTRAQALIELGRLDEARPLVRRLLDGGWDDPTFLDLARKHGLIDPYNERTG
jgi:tetratricopeptide (TPR) repeat protein